MFSPRTRRIVVVLAGVLVVACVVGVGVWKSHDNRVTQHFFHDMLVVSQNTVTKERQQQFIDVITQYFPQMDPETMLRVLESIPGRTCHVASHAIGKLVIQHTQDMMQSLEICKLHCNGGCFHGILLGLFGEPALLNTSEFQPPAGTPHARVPLSWYAQKAPQMCERVTAQGQVEEHCAHGMGHVYMQMSANNLKSSLALCQEFTARHLIFYCTSGVFMERELVTPVPAEAFQYMQPCETETTYPEVSSGCYRFTIRDVLHDLGEDARPRMVQYCLGLPQALHRRGCFHGVGFSGLKHVVLGTLTLDTLCQAGTEDEQKACVDGALAALFPFDEQNKTHTVRTFCTTGPESLQAYCLQTVQDGFGTKHDYTLYTDATRH